jgi:hypothetical protein
MSRRKPVDLKRAGDLLHEGLPIWRVAKLLRTSTYRLRRELLAAAEREREALDVTPATVEDKSQRGEGIRRGYLRCILAEEACHLRRRARDLRGGCHSAQDTQVELAARSLEDAAHWIDRAARLPQQPDEAPVRLDQEVPC